MKWEQYSEQFGNKAKQYGFEEALIQKCLEYARDLFLKKLPIVYDQRHLALLVGYKEEYLYRVSNDPAHFYREFSIPKKSGGERIISEPLPSLKEIQEWILKRILYKCKVSKYTKAYVPKSSIKESARFHRGQKLLLSIDINNFFGSIKYSEVNDFFRGLGYSKAVSTMLANLCCLNGSLPQGAPTSPALSNLLTINVDKRIAGFAIKNGLRYTRYADDLAFSGEFHAGSVIKFVKNVLTSEKFSLNENKIRLMHGHQRQEVTGIVVNQKLQAPKEMRKKLRQSMYYIEKFGLASHLDRIKETRVNYVRHLLGIANFVYFVNPKDNYAKKCMEKLKQYIIH